MIMKQKLELLIALFLCIALGVVAQETDVNGVINGETTRLRGDVNGDGQVGIADVTELIDYILGNQSDDFIVDNADVNDDGSVTIADITNMIDIILGIPSAQPSLTANPNPVDVGNVVLGSSGFATFTLIGENLTEPITLLEPWAETHGGEFSVNKTSLPASGGTVRVTYTPEGTHSSSAQFTFKSGNVTVRVIVNGKGIATPTPEIIAVPDSINFGNVLVGETKTATFTVTGTDVVGNIALTLNYTGDKANVAITSPTTYILPATGGTVKVTVTGLEAGSFSGQINIGASGAETKKVQFSGTVKSVITTSKSTLNFSAAGETAQQTVQCTGANSGLTFSKSGDYSYFTGIPTSITQSQANEGTSFTVTAKPSLANVDSANATVTITGGGADSKTFYISYRKGQPVSISSTQLDSESNKLTGYD